MMDLHKKFLLQRASEAVGKPGAGLTRQYVFDPKHAVDRSLGAMLGKTRMTVLQFLFDKLEPAERKSLFPQSFDLGNQQVPISPSKAALQIELETDPELKLKDGENPEHALRNIKEKIKELTGYHFDKYFSQDAGKSLKVLKLLYLLNLHSEDRLFSLLSAPHGKRKPSLEVASPYPLAENMAAAALIADLKAHLTLELSTERRKEIDQVFEPLRDQLDAIEAELIHLVRERGGFDIYRNKTMLSVLDQALAQLDKPDDIQPLFLPLDEKLYVHCCALEIIHFAKAQHQLYEEHTPTLPVKPIGWQVRSLAAAIQGTEHATTYDGCIPINSFETVVRDHASTILKVLEDGLGYAVSMARYNKAIPLAVKLLRLWKTYGSELGIRAIFVDFDVDPLIALSALASVCHHAGPPATKYRPYWLGQTNDRGNVITALEKIDFEHVKTTVPEEYNRFWIHQLQWFRHALAGQGPVYQHKVAITLHLADAVEAHIRLHDTELLHHRMREYLELPQYMAAILDQVITELETRKRNTL